MTETKEYNPYFTIEDLRDFGYYVEANETMYIPKGDGDITTVSMVNTQGGMFILEHIPFEFESMSMFALVEESRGFDKEDIVYYYNETTGENYPITYVSHDEIGKEVYFQ